MKIDRSLGKTFGTVSSLYDKARIGYPPELISDIIKFSRIKKEGRILEIGCGSGQATISFAEKGYFITGLDISEDLLTIAKEKCATFPNARFITHSFEDALIENNSVDLIISGLAWHWVKPEERYEKAYRILRDQGTLAFFWSYQQKGKSEIVSAVGKIFDKYGRKGAGPAGSRMKEYAEFVYDELRDHPLFGNVEKKEYSVTLEFSREQYINLVFTYSWVLTLTKVDQEELRRELEETLKEYKERLPIPYKFVLVLARKKEVKK